MSIPRWNPCLTLSAKESKLLARHKTSRSSSARELHPLPIATLMGPVIARVMGPREGIEKP